MALSLPPGWTIRAVPSLRPVDAPWLRAVAMTDESGWAVEVAIARGRFPRDSVEARARDVGALGALFRQPYLVAAPAPP